MTVTRSLILEHKLRREEKHLLMGEVYIRLQNKMRLLLTQLGNKLKLEEIHQALHTMSKESIQMWLAQFLSLLSLRFVLSLQVRALQGRSLARLRSLPYLRKNK